MSNGMNEFSPGVLNRIHAKLAYFVSSDGVFLAVQDSSIGDLVTHSLTHSVTFDFS